MFNLQSLVINYWMCYLFIITFVNLALFCFVILIAFTEIKWITLCSIFYFIWPKVKVSSCYWVSRVSFSILSASPLELSSQIHYNVSDSPKSSFKIVTVTKNRNFLQIAKFSVFWNELKFEHNNELFINKTYILILLWNL